MITIDTNARSHNAYDGVAISLHWIIALFTITLLVSGQIAEGLPRTDATRGLILNFHKAGGVIVLGLVLLRSLWRVTHAAPQPIKTSPALDTTANVVHRLLYLLLLLIPITGLGMTFGFGRGVDLLGIPPMLDTIEAGIKALTGFVGIDLLGTAPFKETVAPIAKGFAAAHGIIVKVMLGLVLLHTLAALWHQYFRHDATLGRMVPWLRKPAKD
jgi:cytochrome b561